MVERIRDTISNPITLEYFQQRRNEGWILAAVEWVKAAGQHESATPSEQAAEWSELPYGQKVADDCGHLVEDSFEMQTLLFIYEKVVGGWKPTQIATELNGKGYRTRKQTSWTPSEVFDLLPRLIELGPRLLKRPDWPERRSKLQIIA